MAEMTLASAIVASEPVQLEEPIESHAVKRRLSNEVEAEREIKKQRISPGKNSPSGGAAGHDAEATKEGAKEPLKAEAQEATRKRSSLPDEKQRSKRLFGALLGNLNQPGDRTSKRRQEIESRRKAELQRQDDERVEDKIRRQEKLAERRKTEQVKVDEENMHLRHSNMLHAANFLQTEAEPKLYYRPWDLRADEEDRIDAQIKEAQAQIDQDLENFEARRERNDATTDAHDAQHLTLHDRTEPPTHDQTIEPQSEPKAQMEATKNEDVEDVRDVNDEEQQEDQAPAKSSEDIKPAEVPDSNPTNSDTNTVRPEDVTNDEAMDVVTKAEKTEEKDVDPNVEADDDGVIY